MIWRVTPGFNLANGQYGSDIKSLSRGRHLKKGGRCQDSKNGGDEVRGQGLEWFMVNKVVDKAVDTDKSQNIDTTGIFALEKLTQKIA